MKTDRVAGARNIIYNKAQEAQKNDAKATEESTTSRSVSDEKPYGELKKAVINNPEEVSKMIDESIKWREMKFYQREAGGQMYVDIIDKITGKVIRTVPDTEFAEISAKFKHLQGMSLNISG